MNFLDAASTGLKGLDEALNNLRLGDNVVWQVDNVQSYLHFVKPYIRQALADRKNLVYIRFGNHPPLITAKQKVKTYRLDPDAGFESFTKQVHQIITKEGEGAFYLFDCLSDLLSAWATDLMIGNFFMVTCPYLFKLDTIAYFAILRNNHSFKTIARIRETTQLLLDVYQVKERYYVQPLKVWQRYSPTMFLPHREVKDKFLPLTNSADASRLFAHISSRGAESAQRYYDYWDQLFFSAAELNRRPAAAREKKQMLDRLTRIMIGREPRMLTLAKQIFSLDDLLQIKERMIGTGFIGGKALGMLLARKILTKEWQQKLELHDSFYIGSDVFYTYIVQNGWWELWLEQKTRDGYFSKAAELKEKLLTGVFPDELKERFQQLIEYYGQSPIIVRSSSLLEDSFGNAFAGKYESIFDVNQGSPKERYQRFEQIVRQIFASAMSEDALNYRLQRGLDQLDEQMALLVQRVSGTQRGHYFFPDLAGVAFSYNTFVWHQDMDPKAGMVRLVFGLGTRAVNRVEGDYPRLVALDQPLLRPYSGREKTKRFSQHEVDLLNVEQNILQTVPLSALAQQEIDFDLSLIGVRDTEAESKLRELGLAGPAWVLTFDRLLSATDFAETMRRLAKTVEKVYQYPVDIEFTVNFMGQGNYQINLVQCRPLQAKGSGERVSFPEKVSEEKLLFSSVGNFMGGNVAQPIRRLIVIEPRVYGDLLMSAKYQVARLIGQLNKQIQGSEQAPTMLIGPGRWGSRDPSLGVPVNFTEINNITALIEIDDPEGGFMPELSFGSHFFLDLVEADIFYAALFLENEQVYFNRQWLADLPNQLTKILPEAKSLEQAIKVYEFAAPGLQLLSDLKQQKVICIR